jgi:hypothetical protein
MDAFRRLFEAEERPRTLTVHWHLRHLALAVAPALLLAVLLEPTRRRLVRERAAAPVPTEAAPVEAGTSAATQTDPVAVDDTAALAERVAVLEQALQQALVRLTVREAVSAWAGRLRACTDPGPPPLPDRPARCATPRTASASDHNPAAATAGPGHEQVYVDCIIMMID